MNHDQIRALPWIESGNHFLKEKKWLEAIHCLTQALNISPDCANAHGLIAQAYKKQGQAEKALSSYHRAHELEPENIDHLYNLALFYQESKLFYLAEKHYLELLSQRPDHTDSIANLGRLYQDTNHPDQAQHYYEQDLKLRPDDPDSHFNLAFIHLLRGNYEAGWQEYEWRFKRTAVKLTYPHSYEQSRWQGESLTGKTLLIHGEQGFGDNLQFLRYVPLVKKLGDRVRIILEIPQALAPLIKDFPGIDQLLIYNHERTTNASFDYYVPLLSLAGIFKTTPSSIPEQIPLIKASTQLRDRWSRVLTSPLPKIALVWGGHAKPDPLRSCSAEEFLPLCKLDGIDFYGLQTGIHANEVQTLTDNTNFQYNFGPELTNFADTAAIISQLDLTITIDTATAHLAGAMGHEVWVLLPFAPDWRWFLERSDSPWYPSMRLFRQPEPGNWQPVISAIKSELEQFRHHNLLEK